MGSRRHLTAVNKTIQALELASSPGHAAIIELARDLAKQMDYAGAKASGRLQERYRGALKQLTRQAPTSVADERAPDEVDELEAFKREWRVRPEDSERYGAELGPRATAAVKRQQREMAAVVRRDREGR